MESGVSLRKAMILAAGFGTRLKPLTDSLPKPLLQVGGVPMIHYGLRLLKRNGIEEVVINLHHLGRMVRENLGDGASFGLKIFYSEEPQILGTGGGLKKAQSFLEGGPFVLMNCDILTRVDLHEVFEFHRSKNAISTLVLRGKDTDRYNNIIVNEELYIKDIAGRLGFSGRAFKTGIFAGIHIIEPEIFSYLPAGVSSITDRYVHLLREGRNLAGFFTDSFWVDLGNMENYQKMNEEIKNRRMNLDALL